MAKKSKTQRAKASEKRAAKKVALQEQDQDSSLAVADETAKARSAASTQTAAKTPAKKEEKPAKKKRFAFFREVRSEMKRVTWPTRQDVLRWSGVVVCALLFFGLYVALLDNAIITPLLVAFSGLGA